MKEQNKRQAKGMLSVEENNMSSITKDSATFTTKEKCFWRGGLELIQLILERSDC